MIHFTKPIDDATPLDDISGLKLPNDKVYTLKELADDIEFWDTKKTFDIYEKATRIHHRAVQIHPFKNGNGRWSRMLANISLRQNGSMPVKWQEDLLSKENSKRDEYIQSLKVADNGDYSSLIAMHKVTY